MCPTTPSAPSTTIGSVSSRTLPAGRSPATSTIRVEEIIGAIEDAALRPANSGSAPRGRPRAVWEAYGPPAPACEVARVRDRPCDHEAMAAGCLLPNAAVDFERTN